MSALEGASFLDIGSGNRLFSLAARMWIESGTLRDDSACYPIADGIPRFVGEADRGIDGDTQESFGYEWQHFAAMLPDYDLEIESYFGIVPDDTFVGFPKK